MAPKNTNTNTESIYRKAAAALEAANAAVNAHAVHRRERFSLSQHLGFDLAGAEVEIAQIRAELTRNEAADRFNCSSSDLDDLREYLISELAAASHVFSQEVARPGEVASLAGHSAADVAKRVEALSAQTTEQFDAHRRAAVARLHAVYQTVLGATDLLRVARKAAGLPLPKAVVPFLNNPQEAAIPARAQECQRAITAVRGQREYVERDNHSMKRHALTRLEEAVARVKAQADADAEHEPITPADYMREQAAQSVRNRGQAAPETDLAAQLSTARRGAPVG